jgi:hypothetical protein
MARSKDSDETYSRKEAAERFSAALRGARMAGHKSMADLKAEKPKKSKRKSPRKFKTKRRA